MKKYQQLEKLFGRPIKVDEITLLAQVFERDLDFLYGDSDTPVEGQRFSDMPVRSRLSGRTIKYDDFEYQWQQFCLSRQEVLEEKLVERAFLPQTAEVEDEVYGLLEKVETTMGDSIVNELGTAITNQQNTLTYIYYNKGYFDGIKYALMAGKL
ncbi:hypothetical protein P22_3515 [Propionispora sp. 2/2-37]|uniref:hypothetical protein n=1 Tax=Propionispora sp. 2/2-37 TaxID=1677858 RepID=UPI0006BB7C53|nr:hypothetical protein [Propionispora sp. 2/2-37]CUH97387.1 hypothetical protein P22_3515 [Propionispora sp. 2/2-37]